MSTVIRINLGSYGERCIKELVDEEKEKAEKKSPEDAEISKKVADKFLEKIGGTIDVSWMDITEETATDFIRFGLSGIITQVIRDEIEKAKANHQ